MISKADFIKILPVTLNFEGGYSCLKNDKGGETYRGISRKSNPDWEGWKYLERHKPLVNGDIINDEDLKNAVRELYYSKYFLANGLQYFNILPALMCFDFAVNGGFSKAKLQAIINDRFGGNLVVDGIIGEKSIAAINGVNPVELSHAILDARKCHFDSIIESDPSQEMFKKGWDNRIAFLRRLVIINDADKIRRDYSC